LHVQAKILDDWVVWRDGLMPSVGAYILKREKGFSLIELMLVLVVLVILAALVSSQINSVNTIKINNAASKVVADLRYVQQLSMSTRTRHGLTIESTQQYSIHVDNGGIDSYLKDPTKLGQNFIVNFDAYQQGQLNGVRFNSTTPFCTIPSGCATCGPVIEFDSLGSPTNTAGTPLCNATITMTKNGAANQTITVEANTGKVAD
jgi:prepilin-type N-terminal cleavage/methylation domain-containing protein